MRKNINGFTIIEILVAIAIIGILATIGITSFTKIQIQSRDKDRLSKATLITEALEKYYEENGEYPSCSSISAVPSNMASKTLGDIDLNIFAAPTASNGTNSVTSCVSVPIDDTFSYLVSSDLESYSFKYKEELTGDIKTINSRHIAFNAIEAPTNPMVTVASPDNINVQATVIQVSCNSGTPYYSFSNHINGGAWSAWSNWDTVLTSSQAANDGVKYGYKARARCQVPGDETQISTASIGLESTYTDPIPAPAAPTVTATTAGSNTNWSWPAVSCTAGSPYYQYDYTITPSGYDSGWRTTNNLSIVFTTSTEGQTYTVYVQARCSNINTVSTWSESGSASYHRPSGDLTLIGTIPTGSSPNNVAISNDGNFVYVDNNASYSISMYSRNAGTGVLTSIGTIATGRYPRGIIVSPDDKSVYVSNSYDNTISSYSRNISTGALTLVDTDSTGASPRDVAVSPDGTSVYVANNNSDNLYRYSRNTTTGALTYLGSTSTGDGPECVILSPDGTSVYVSNTNSNTISMYSRNVGTGALTALSPATISTGSYPWGLSISDNGNSVYATNNASISMYSRNVSTGALTALSPATITIGSEACHIDVSIDGISVYAASGGTNRIYMYRRNTSTGVLTASSPSYIAAGTYPDGIVISPDGKSVYATNLNSNTLSMYSRN